MKIENKHFLIIIEKKKVEKTPKKKNRLLISAVSLLILTLGVGGGIFIFNQNKKPSDEVVDTVAVLDEKVEGTYVTSSYLASNAKEKYKEDELYGYTYGEPVKGLKRDESIDLEMNFDTSGIEYWNEIFAIYQDPELTQELTPNNEYDEENGVVHINPPTYTDGNISTMGLNTEEVTKYNHSEHKLFDKNDGSDWGNIGTLYLAKYRDLKTGEILEKPEVSIITLEGEVTSNPQITFSITQDGRAKLHWDAVEGATDYYICTIAYYEDKGLDGNAWPIGVTSETEWVYESPDFDTYSIANKDFKFFDVSQEDWYDEYSSERAEEKYGIKEGVYKDTSVWGENYLCVIAVNEDGTSMISNTYPFSEIAANLPYAYASNKAKENGFKSSGYDSIDEVSAYGYVTMCDGYTATKLIDYQTQKAEIVTERYIETDEEGNYIEGVNVPVLKIPYIIEGTPFEYVAEVTDYDEQFLEKDLAFIDEREEKLRKRAGDVEINTDIDISEEEKIAVESEVREVKESSITANCALSEYLAMNMLGHNVLIDLSEFPEASDPEIVSYMDSIGWVLFICN